MLDILQQKLLSWSPDKANQFFNNMPRFLPFTGRIWEMAPTGYFLYDSTYSAYFDYNGQTYSILLGDVSANYTNKQVLSDYATANNLISIEKPTLIQTVSIYNVQYTYVEEIRPYGSLGIGLINITLVPNITPAERLSMIITVFNDAKLQLQTISTACGRKDYSTQLDMYENIYYDPGTQKYFLVGNFCADMTDGSAIFDQYISKLQSGL